MRSLIAAIMTTSLVFFPVFAAAEPNLWSTVGTLECTTGPSGPARGARQALCVFRSSAADTGESYVGRMERTGPDMMLTAGKLVWVVLSRMERLPPKSLVGRFSGPREDIMVGEAVEAAAALCRGTQRAVCLQPLAGADHEDGDNLAVSVSALRLEYDWPQGQ